MVLTLILLSIGALLFLVITYNIVQQYKQKQETDRRILMSRQKLIIDESDELLLKRMKKRKLRLKDQIAWIDNLLIPDEPA